MTNKIVLEEKKLNILKDILLTNIDTDILVEQWNDMCKSGYSILRFNSIIYSMDELSDMILLELIEDMGANFNYKHKYYAYTTEHKIISFNNPIEYNMFDPITLVHYLIGKSSNIWKNYEDDILNILISNFEDDIKDKSKLYIKNLINMAYIDIYKSNWDNIYKAIKGFIEIQK